MYHSITFGDKNTWDDWHLIPSKRPSFNPPTVKSQYVDIPGGNGVLDLTESLTGYPLYNTRTGSWTFYVENGFKPWDELYSEISNYLHGQKLRAILEDDPGFYYEGRFTVDEWNSDSWWSTITISYDVYPYKKELTSSLEDWLWDPFNFDTGIVREYGELEVNNTLSLEIPSRQEYICPKIIVASSDGSGMNLQYNSKTYHLNDGENLLPEVTFGGGVTVTLKFTGNGTVSVDYQGGSL